jgi:hypothetical protein
MDQAQTKVNAHNQLPRRHGQKDDARAHGGLFALPEFAVFQRWDVAFFPPGWLRRRQADLITVQVPASLVMSRTIGVHFSARHLRASLLGITNVVRGGTAVFIMIAFLKKIACEYSLPLTLA